MKNFEIAIAITGILFVAGSAVTLAADETPTPEQVKNSKDRGLIFTPMGGSDHKTDTKVTAPSKTQTKVETKTTTKAVTHVQTNKAPSKNAAHATTAPHSVKAHQTHTVHAASAATTKPSKDVSPQITVVPASSSDTGIIQASLNKGGAHPHYRDGEKMQITVSAARTCNLMIFDFDGMGRLTQLYPNQYQPSGTVHTGEKVIIGGEESPFSYQASLPSGQKTSQERIFIYAYPVDSEAPLSVAMTSMPNTAFRSAEISLDEYRKLVNQSKVFFSREVKIVPKQPLKLANAESATPAPNKLELPFVIEK